MMFLVTIPDDEPGKPDLSRSVLVSEDEIGNRKVAAYEKIDRGEAWSVALMQTCDGLTLLYVDNVIVAHARTGDTLPKMEMIAMQRMDRP